MKGELLIVLSASGGGKSTILKLTVGLMKPDEGRILIDGEDITDYDEEELNRIRLRIGTHFQDGALSLIRSPFTTTWLSDAMNTVYLKRSSSRKYVVCCGPCELGIKLRDLLDVSAILVTHGIEHVRFIASTYAGYGPDGEVMLLEEKDRLCLINTKIMMLRNGQMIFIGSDEELFRSDDTYIREFLLL
jgi:phospholipid/cholesterol/gamma-HCH transport system ATP-binding protein